MEKNGYVVFSDDKIAKIMIKRESSCGGNCSHCKGCGTDEIVIETENNQGLETGECVKVIMDDSNFLKKMLWGYGLVIVFIVSGTTLGYSLFENDIIVLMFFLGFLAVGLFILRMIFRNKNEDIKIKRIV